MAVQARAQAQAQPARHRFTKDDYHRMGKAGILGEDDRVELIDGEIIDMPPIGDDHVGGVNQLNWLLNRRLGDDYIVSVQNPVRLPGDNEPQPDIVVTRRQGRKGGVPAAADVLMLIEVSDTTLAYDRRVKLPLYAAAGIPEVWIVDLESKRVLVYRSPEGRRYQHIATVERGAALAPAALPDLILPADAVLV